MKTNVFICALLLIIAAGCEGFNGIGEDARLAEQSIPVLYAYNTGDERLMEISAQDQQRLKGENTLALHTLFQEVKIEKERRPERLEEMYIYEDELEIFESKINTLKAAYAESPMRSIVEQQMALNVIDQFLRLPEGEEYSMARLSLISQMAEILLFWESHDVRVLGDAVLLLKDVWEKDRLLDAIHNVEATHDRPDAVEKSPEASIGNMPAFIQAAHRKQKEKEAATLAALAGLKQILMENSGS